MTFDATMVGVPAFANNGPRTEKLCWGLNPSKLQPDMAPATVQIVELEVFTWICDVPCAVNNDGGLLSSKRVETPDKTMPVTRDDRSRTRSALIELPFEFGFRLTCTCWPTIRSAGASKSNPV